MMRVLTLLLAGLLLGAAPAEVPIGTFREWLSFKNVPLEFVSGGVTIRVKTVSCPADPIGDSGCRWDGYDNQGKVTVRAPGLQCLYAATAVAVGSQGRNGRR